MIASPFDRRAVEDALYEWALGATGVVPIWLGQRINQLRPPYITLQLASITTDAPFERRVNGEPDDPGAGEEVEITYCAISRIVLSCNTYGVSNEPRSDARAVMDKLLASLHMDAASAPLSAAGLALVDTGAALSLDELVDEAHLSRVQCDITFSLAQNITERTGYIATAEVTSTDFGWTPATFVVEE